MIAAVKKWKCFQFSFNSNSGGCIVILQNVFMQAPGIFHVLPECFHAACKKFKQSRLRVRIINRLGYTQYQLNSNYVDEKCDKNRAVFNYNRKRCYFVMRFPYLGYNLTESIEQCHSKGAILSYPRHHEEVSDTWTYFSSHLERTDELRMKDLLANTTLHVGFLKTERIEFRSVDKTLNVNTVTHPIMLDTVQPFNLNFSGPADCINRYHYLKRCMHRMRSQFAICSVDLQ